MGGPAHAALARELAERSLTLVRDDARRLPLALPADATILAVMPTPIDLTPADTSSTVAPGLAAALRTRFARVEEVVTSAAPTDAEIAAVRDRVGQADAVVVGTIDGAREPSQLAPARGGRGGRPATGPSSRSRCGRPGTSPSYPAGVAAVCTYSIHAASMVALADALSGAIPFAGRLPVRVDGVAARPPVTLHDEILEQPAVATRFLETQAGAIDALAAALRDRATGSSTSSSPPAARRTTPRSTRSTCSGSATG